MDQGSIIVYHGDGAGKSSAALGHALRVASSGGTVYVIQFLKGQIASDFVQRLEPEMKLFRFERLPKYYDEMTEAERTEEKKNISNGISYARKVLATGECDMLVLDEVLGAIAEKIFPEEELLEALAQKSSQTTVIMTGRRATPGILDVSDVVLNIHREA